MKKLIDYQYCKLTIISISLIFAVAGCSTAKVEKPAEKLVASADKSYSLTSYPVFPGCEKFTKQANLHQCLENKVGKYFRKKFNTDVAEETGLSGRLRSYIQFSVNTNGKADDIRVKSPHPAIKREAIRILKLLPLIKPGVSNGEKVAVKFTLPFTFVVE